MTRRRLQWLAILTPTLTVTVIVFTHNLWHRYAYSFSWFHLAVLGVILLTSYLFTLFVFQAMDRLEQTVRQRNQELAILQERDRLAKEVHDGLAQVLGLLSLKVAGTHSLVTQGEHAQARAELQEIEKTVREAYVDAREAILGLRTSVGVDGGLVRSLTEYVNAFRRQSGVNTELIVPPNLPPLPPPVEVQLVRIIQEALTNVRKHAQATKVRLSFSYSDGWTKVVVEDDGHGFDPAQALATGGFGLQSMRERAEGVGGSFRLVSSTQGTKVEVSLPTKAGW